MRSTSFFLGISVLVATGLAACGGNDNTATVCSASDAGPDAPTTNGSTDGGPLDATMDIDGGDSAPPSDSDAADAGDAEANDAGDGEPTSGASLRLAPGSQVLGVTSDAYVIYLTGKDASSAQTLMAVSASGGAPQVLSATFANARLVVAGATVVWVEYPVVDAGAPPSFGPLRTWSSAKGVLQIDPLIAAFGVSADGSRVVFVHTIESEFDGGTYQLDLLLTSTAGNLTRLGSLTSESPYVELDLIGSAVKVKGTKGRNLNSFQVLSADSLEVTIDNVESPAIAPTGAWAWSARGLALTASGTVVFSYTSTQWASFYDATGANLFYATPQGVAQLPLATPTQPSALPGTGGTGACGAYPGLIAAAPNAGAVLCTAGSDAGASFDVVTTGAAPTTFALPAPATSPSNPLPPFFLPDSTVAWMDGSTLFSEPVLGGPALTLATSVNSYLPIGGSQIAVVNLGPSAPAFVVDAAGKLPKLALLPTPDYLANQQTLFAPPAGGLVAYSSGGAIYAVRTR